jgi:hypothetical protein
MVKIKKKNRSKTLIRSRLVILEVSYTKKNLTEKNSQYSTLTFVSDNINNSVVIAQKFIKLWKAPRNSSRQVEILNSLLR